LFSNGSTCTATARDAEVERMREAGEVIEDDDGDGGGGADGD
jgi:hypothetical protein